MPDLSHTGSAAKADPGQQAADRGADALTSVAQTMVEVARLAMDQGQETIRLCLNTMGNAQAPVAESTYARGRQMMADGARILDTYRQLTDRSMDDFQAMTNAYAALGRGIYRWQRTFADAVLQTFEKFGNKPQELLHCNSAADVARLHRDLCFEAASGMIAYNIAALQALSQAAQEALRPLNEHGRRSA